MSYGYRRAPFGNQARLSKDHGHSWSTPITISDDAPGGDVGYPSTVELADGQLVTVWYETMANLPRAVLRKRQWSLG
jgi:sialidase-1